MRMQEITYLGNLPISCPLDLDALKELEKSKILGLDTEAEGLKIPHFHKMSLIQISTGSKTFIVQPNRENYKCPNIVKILENENKKVGNNLAAKIMADIVTYHTTPIEAAEIANQANVKHLVFYHLTPAPRNALMESMFVRGVNDIRKEWTLSKDGTLVILPLNSEKIEITKIN